MHSEKRDFDAAAASWDDKPGRVTLAGEVAAAIRSQVKLEQTMNALDFGCGTGLLTLALQPHVRTIIGADSSRGMLDVFNAKIAAAELANVCSMLYDPERDEKLHGRYHLIVSSMTLHHVEQIEPLLTRFHDALLPGGHLCLADLDLEQGRFHDDNTGVFHFGFDRAALAATLGRTGFGEIIATTASQIVKTNASGNPQSFSVFLLCGQKAE